MDHEQASPIDEREKFMRMALDAAVKGRSKGEVPVGCVFVREGKVIAEGWNQTNESCNVRHHSFNS